MPSKADMQQRLNELSYIIADRAAQIKALEKRTAYAEEELAKAKRKEKENEMNKTMPDSKADLIEWINEAKDVADWVIRRVATGGFYRNELTDVGKQLGETSTVDAAAEVYFKFTETCEVVRSRVHSVILDVVVRLICYEYKCIPSRCDFETAAKEVFGARYTQALQSRIHQSFRRTTANIAVFAPALKPFSPRRRSSVNLIRSIRSDSSPRGCGCGVTNSHAAA